MGRQGVQDNELKEESATGASKSRKNRSNEKRKGFYPKGMGSDSDSGSDQDSADDKSSSSGVSESSENDSDTDSDSSNKSVKIKEKGRRHLMSNDGYTA